MLSACFRHFGLKLNLLVFFALALAYFDIVDISCWYFDTHCCCCRETKYAAAATPTASLIVVVRVDADADNVCAAVLPALE